MTGRTRDPDAHAPVVLDADHPWPGLVSFTESGAAFFFGREREIAELSRLVRQDVLTVLFGKSGLGKSSILRAGLGPVLRNADFVPVFIRLDHGDETPALEAQVKTRIGEVLDDEQIEAPRPEAGESLWEYFHRRGADWWSDDNRLLKPILVFDQFEELLTTGREHRDGEARSGRFLTELEDLVENRPPAALLKRFEAERGLARQFDLDRAAYRVVLALREDFLADLEGLHERLRAIMSSRFRLLPMSGEQALDVVLEPGRHLVSESVALQIVDFVSSSRGTRARGAAAGSLVAEREVEPALLSVVLQELNTRRLQAGRSSITADLVGEAQAAQILEQFYERGMLGMDDRIRDFVVDALLTSSGARNRVAEEDALTKYGIAPAAIAALIDRRILQRHSSGGSKWLELTHDTLADVVRVDRTERDKRREVAAAAAREADVRRQLARTHRLAATFAALLLVALVGLAIAYVKHVQLRDKQQQLERARAEEQEAQANVSAKSRHLSTKTAQLARQAEREAGGLLSQLRQEIDDPTPGGAARASQYLAQFDTLAAGIDTPALRALEAQAAATAARVLYANGHVAEGLANAQRAVRTAVSLEASAADTPHVRAAAHAALGQGLLETGRLDEASAEFHAALGQRADAAAVAAPMPRDDQRTWCAALIGIAEIDRRTHALAEATRTLNEVLRVLGDTSKEGAAFDETAYQRALTLEQLGNTEDAPATQDQYLARAAALAGRMTREAPHNLRWSRLMTQLAYERSFVLMQSSSFADTEARLEAALARSDTLARRDQDNLAWSFLVAQIQRDLGMLYQKGGPELRPAAHQRFEAMRRVTERIDAREPAWVPNRYLRAISFYYLADTLPPDDRGAADLYARAFQLLGELVRDSPGQAEYIRSAGIAAQGVARVEASRRHYAQARAILGRAETLMASLPRSASESPRFEDVLASIHESEAYYVAMPAHRPREAIAAYQRAICLRRAIADAPAAPISDFVSLAAGHSLLADAYLLNDDERRAAESFDSSVAALDRGLSQYPGSVALLQEKARTYRVIFAAWRRRHAFQPALDSLAHGADAAQAAFDLDPVNHDVFLLVSSISKDVEQFEQELRSGRWPATGLPGGPGGASAMADQVKARFTLAPDRLLRPRGAREAPDRKSLELPDVQRWAIEPLIPGNWTTLPPAERDLELTRFQALVADKHVGIEKVLRIRVLPLSFYRGAVLYEAEVVLDTGVTGAISYLRSGGSSLIVNGTSPPIHAFNRQGRLRLDTSSQAAAYLAFFTAAIAGEDGNFRIVNSPSDLAFVPEATARDRERALRLISPLQMSGETAEGKWNARGTIRYRGALFYTLLQVGRSGNVVMDGDTPAAVEQPILSERFVRGVRVATDLDYREERLAGRVERASRDAKWTDAVSSQRQLVELLRHTPALDDVSRRSPLVEAYRVLAWAQIHARDFAGALASADAGLAIDPASLPLTANRAHALLLLGRVQDAESLYRRHVGQKIGNRTWQEAIESDLQTLERDGVSTTDFASARRAVSETQ